MSFRKRLVILVVFVLLVGALDALLAPFFVARGVRLWLSWAARKQGLQADVQSVEAPFLHPVTVRRLHVVGTGGGQREVLFEAATLEVDLNFRGWLFGQQANLLRSIAVDRLSGRIRVPANAASIRNLDWRQLARLLPDNFRVDQLDLEIATALTNVSLRGLSMSASAIESGKFFAREISISSPVLRQTFRDLRGATSWEGAHLTIAGIPLIAGLDLEALTIDLSHLAKRRLGIDLQLDTYGGTLRASLEGRAREKFALDVAGSASNLSLAQVARALGFFEPITGAVRASKFTFRGNPGEFLDATASVWVELAGFSWRAHRADNVMLGATYYDRRLEIDQLYVQQRQNELTINGELLWPKKAAGWWPLPFRGQLNATLPDLNGFAQLFGATTGDFSGAILADGEIDALAPEAHGRFALHGEEVKFRGVALDSLGASFRLRESEATIEKLEARHGEDFFRAEGSADLAAPHHFSGRLTCAINDLEDYAPILPAAWRAAKIGGGATFDWRGDGTLGAHSGTMQLFAHGLQLPVAPLRMPLDLTLEGSYSPQDIFFRTFRVANDRVSLGGFLMLGKNFVELQALRLDLDGQPRIKGTVFLPFAFNRWRASGSLLEALDEAQKFDVDLAVDRLDLGGLANALGEESSLTGVLDGKLAAFGALRALQLTTSWRLENLGSTTARNAIDFHGGLEDGRADAEATAVFGVSDPITFRASLPLDLEKDRLASGTALERAAPFSLEIDCPALFLESLPNELRPGGERGLLAGEIRFSHELQNPTIQGEAWVLDLSSQPPAPWPAISGLNAQIRFADRAALIDPLRLSVDGLATSWRGRLTATLDAFGLALQPAATTIEVASLPGDGAALSAVRFLGEGANGSAPQLREAFMRGRTDGGAASLTISAIDPAAANAPFQTTVFFPGSATRTEPLLLRVISPTETKELAIGNSEPAHVPLSDRQNR